MHPAADPAPVFQITPDVSYRRAFGNGRRLPEFFRGTRVDLLQGNGIPYGARRQRPYATNAQRIPVVNGIAGPEPGRCHVTTVAPIMMTTRQAAASGVS